MPFNRYLLFTGALGSYKDGCDKFVIVGGFAKLENDGNFRGKIWDLNDERAIEEIRIKGQGRGLVIDSLDDFGKVREYRLRIKPDGIFAGDYYNDCSDDSSGPVLLRFKMVEGVNAGVLESLLNN